MRLLFLLVFFLPSYLLFSQKADGGDSLITIKGKVIDTSYAVGFYNTVVVNKSVGKGIFGEYDGSFVIRVKKSDLIGVSVSGYQTYDLSYKDSVYRDTFYTTIYVQPLEYMGNEVVVKPRKTLEQLREERAAIAKREVPTVTVANAISSPITALYVAFSKREKTKRKVAEMEYQDKQEDIVKEILHLYVHHDILDLKHKDFEEFVVFLNLNTEFLKMASDYELISYIQDKYEHFKKIKEGF